MSAMKGDKKSKEIQSAENCTSQDLVLERNLKSEKDDIRRIQSVKQTIKTYRQQQQAIRTALHNLDKTHNHNNKIIFNDSDDVNHELNGFKKDDKSNTHKVLFESDNEDNETYNFEFKDDFAGTEGKQLLELQSKFKGDKRFNLDKRFIDSDPASLEVRTSSVTNEISLEDEKEQDINILKEVLATSNQLKSGYGKKQNYNLHKSSVRTQNQRMLRYDPTQSDHLKYELQQSSNKEKIKKRNKKDKNKVPEQTKEPIVSKDVFYKVSKDLKDTFEPAQNFSLLNMFGTSLEEKNDNAEESHPEEVNLNRLQLGANPFKFDSSEDEAEEKEEIYDQNANDFTKQPNTANILPLEGFFFKEDDYRLQEGSDFVRRIASEGTSEFGQQRKQLKKIMRTKVRNNNKKHDPFRRKLGGNKRKKVLRIKKALNR